MKSLFNTILYQPLFNLLIFFYQHLHDLGLAIIFLTIIIRLVLLPFFYKSAKDQAIIQRLAPKIKEIQKNHKGDPSTQTQAMMALYKEHKINPLSSFLLLIIQLPILIALYRVFLRGIPGIVARPLFLGLIDLAKPNIFIITIAAIVTFWQTVISMPKTAKNKQMFLMPLMMPLWIVIILRLLPSAVGLYILASTLFSVIQQIIINKTLKVGFNKTEKNGSASRNFDKSN